MGDSKGTAGTMTHRADAKYMLDDRGYSGKLIRGQNPALLMEKPVRDRITESYYWKEQCFGLNEATLCDRAVELTFVGGTFGPQQRPSPFLCLAFKMLQLNLERDVVLEYLGNEDFKYLRALAAFYVRLTFDPAEVYKTLEPLLADYRKLKRRTRTGFTVTYIDQFVDELLTKDRICATSLWKLSSRQQLEDLELLDERVSPLGGEIDEIDADELDVEAAEDVASPSSGGDVSEGVGVHEEEDGNTG
ncbi:MAG: hypothetical protein M1838_006078 [Thelocarpon superellum]|nr:MAG: hypothetical protein M1838_006078 [Thelocarpon superellum]